MQRRQTAILFYLLVINIITFAYRGWDKRQAVKQKRRIREKTLLKLIGMGGFVGGLSGMSLFRHKTIKRSFLSKFRLAAMVWIAIVVVVLYVS